jgi:phosphoglycolate phosphatase
MFRAALFDLDGTLMDSTADIAWCGNELMRRHNFPTHPLDHFNRFIGDGVINLVRRMLPEDARRDDLIASLAQEFKTLYADHWAVESHVYEGIPEMLAALRARKLRLAVLSNKPHEFTQQCVAHFLPNTPFDIVRGAGNGGGGFPNKPDPAAALDIARRLEIPPADFVYLGDTNTDMQTATRAGMFAIGVLWGLRDRAELESTGAKAVLAHPRDLLTVISSAH